MVNLFYSKNSFSLFFFSLLHPQGPPKPTANLNNFKRNSSGNGLTQVDNNAVLNYSQFQPKLPTSPQVARYTPPAQPTTKVEQSLVTESSNYAQAIPNQTLYAPMMNYVIDPNQFQYQLQVQQQIMLSQYMIQAFASGTPTCLPIFCTKCIRPFTYPIKATTVKCPFCYLVHTTPASPVDPLKK